MATFSQSCIREVYPREIQIQKHFLHFLVVNKVFCPFSVSGGINFSAYVLKMAHKMGISSRESLLIVVSYILHSCCIRIPWNGTQSCPRIMYKKSIWPKLCSIQVLAIAFSHWMCIAFQKRNGFGFTTSSILKPFYTNQSSIKKQ